MLVGALVLAALFNVDSLVERAENKPLGASRDRALAFWHPVQDITQFVQIHRLRQLADALTGKDDDDGSSAAAFGTPVDETTATRPELRQPTAAAPLRLWVGGDSIVQVFGESVVRLAGETGVVEPTLHYEISTGLTRPDYFDWPAALRADLERDDPEVVVIMFGANDAQGMELADGTVFQRVAEPGWQREYARRVGAVMDLLRADGRLVYWVGQPVMRDSGFDDRMAILDRIYASEAAGRPWVEYVDTRALFADRSGSYAEYLTGPDGDAVDLRQDDGIHLTREGGDRMANAVLDLLAREVDLTPGRATPRASPATGSPGEG